MTPAWTDADGAELDVLVHALVFDYWEHRKHCEACRPERCPDLEAWKAHKAECRAVRVTRRSPSGSRASATSNSSITTVAAARAACRARTCRPRSAKSATGARHACCSHGPRRCEQSSRGVRCERLALTGRPRRAPRSVHRVPHTEARAAVALWVLHCHALDAFDSTPRLALLSPEKGSGKTRTARGARARRARTDAHRQHVRRRAIPRRRRPPTNPPPRRGRHLPRQHVAKQHEDIRGLINAGHRRGATRLPRRSLRQDRPRRRVPCIRRRAHSQASATYQTRSSTAPSSSR